MCYNQNTKYDQNAGYLDKNIDFNLFIKNEFENFLAQQNIVKNINMQKIQNAISTNNITKKTFDELVITIKKTNNNDITSKFFLLIDKIFNNLDKYLYIFSPKKYISEILMEKSSFRILNSDFYILDTVIVDNVDNIYKVDKSDPSLIPITNYIIDTNGNIYKYEGTEIYYDMEFSEIACVDEESRIANIYKKILEKYTEIIEREIHSYLSICKVSKPFYGLGINEFFNNLFILGSNNEIIINKSYNNIINQLIYTGQIINFIQLINVTLNDHTDPFPLDKYNYDENDNFKSTRYTIDYNLMKSADINSGNIINNDIFTKIYDDLIISIYSSESNTNITNTNFDFFKKIEQLMKTQLKNNNGVPYVLDKIKKIITSIELTGIIDENMITTFNTSQMLNIKKHYFSQETNVNKLNYMKTLVNILKYSSISKEKIKMLIIAQIIKIILPFSLYPYFNSDDLISYIFVYMVQLLDTGSTYNINKRYVYDRIFGKNYNKDPTNTYCKTYLSTLPQCFVEYYEQGELISHASCAESTLLNILKSILVDKNEINVYKLSKYIQNRSVFHNLLIKFFTKNNNMTNLRSISACREFTQLISNIDGINYGNKIDKYYYDLYPEFNNVMKLFFYILTGSIEDHTEEEYKDMLQKMFSANLINKSQFEKILELENITCTFTQTHAYIGNMQSAFNVDEPHYFSIIYLTLYFNTHGSSLIKHKIKDPKLVQNIVDLIYMTNLMYIDYSNVLADIPQTLKSQIVEKISTNDHSSLFKLEIEIALEYISDKTKLDLETYENQKYILNNLSEDIENSEYLYVNTLFYLFTNENPPNYNGVFGYSSSLIKMKIFNVYLFLEKTLRENIANIYNAYRYLFYIKDKNISIISIYQIMSYIEKNIQKIKKMDIDININAFLMYYLPPETLKNYSPETLSKLLEISKNPQEIIMLYNSENGLDELDKYVYYISGDIAKIIEITEGKNMNLKNIIISLLDNNYFSNDIISIDYTKYPDKIEIITGSKIFNDGEELILDNIKIRGIPIKIYREHILIMKKQSGGTNREKYYKYKYKYLNLLMNNKN